MKKRILTIMYISALAVSILVGCGNKTESIDAVDNGTSVVAESTTEAENDIAEAVETEAPHEHSFTESITKEATCIEAGEKTLTCECGESSVEVVHATGHDFSNYVSNEDATYTADGTETATCTCGETDTRVAEGSMLTYTVEEMEVTKYAKSTVNIRSFPYTDGEKLGSLSTNDEVKVTGKCTETGWYRIEYSDGIAYVSDEYLVDEKVEVQASAPAASSEPFPYELYTVYDDGTVAWFYCVGETGRPFTDAFWNAWNAAQPTNRARHGYLLEPYNNGDANAIATFNALNLNQQLSTPWTYNGVPVKKFGAW